MTTTTTTTTTRKTMTTWKHAEAKRAKLKAAEARLAYSSSFCWAGSAPPQQHFWAVSMAPTSCAAIVLSCNRQGCQVQAWASYNARDIRSNCRTLELRWMWQQKVAWSGAATNVTVPLPAVALRNRRQNVHAISDGNVLEVIWENHTSTTLLIYCTPVEANSTLRVFGSGAEARVDARWLSTH